MRLHGGEGAQAVAEFGGTLELQIFGSLLHGLGQLVLHPAAFAKEEGLGLGHEGIVAVLVNLAHAWRGTALDLIEQAGSVAAFKNGI